MRHQCSSSSIESPPEEWLGQSAVSMLDTKSAVPVNINKVNNNVYNYVLVWGEGQDIAQI